MVRGSLSIINSLGGLCQHTHNRQYRIADTFYSMGRPSLGVRKQIGIRLPPDLITRVDNARGPMTRDAWFAAAAELGLKPTSQIINTELKQDVHHHVKGRRIRSIAKRGEATKVFYECTGCEMEIEG